MNLMMASGGYPWTVMPVGDRKIDTEGLEKASVGEDVVPFGDFLSGLVKKGLAGSTEGRIMKVCGEKEDVAGWLSCQK